MSEYLTITEFAKAAGVSRQTIYRRLDNVLKGYIIKEAHRIKINKDAIYMFEGGDIDKEETWVTKGNEIKVLQKMSHDVQECNIQEKSMEKLIGTLESIQRTMDKLVDTLVKMDEAVDKPKQSFWEKFISRK